jgi:vitamin B12 transporter
MPALPIDTDQIVITASRAPESEARTPASVTIIDQQLIQRLDEPLAYDFLRLVPSAAVSTSGPAGSLTDVRIRGAEANHTLLFVDGIRANDPASGDQPRFDLLNADIASRIEVIRGPQSALWGSDAIGGVVAVNGTPETASQYAAGAEGGSFGFERANGSFVSVTGTTTLAAAVGFQRATGIDSFNGHGDKDGYRNLSGRVRATWNLSPAVQLGATAFAIGARDEFDGFDPLTFLHADTLDNSRNRMAAGRLWAQFGSDASSWSGRFGISDLASSNRNYLAHLFQNRTSGTRRTADAQLEHRFDIGSIANTIVAAADTEREGFRARDVVYGGFSDQDRTRNHDSVTLEWRADARRFTGDVAVRHDFFNRFKDATTVRGSLLAQLGGGFSVAGSYSEGIAQPTFFDLYGFFPGSFVGNPSLKPESSRGFELSGRYRRGPLSAALTYYRQRLHDEIVDTFDASTFLSSTANRSGVSHRSGVEAELGWQLGKALRLSANYAYLHATQPNNATGQVREVRRPNHSGSLALDGSVGGLTYGASLAYVGERKDTNFDVFPSQTVVLRSYWLGGARVGYAIRPGIELFGRVSNALNQNYQDVYGYRTEPRAVYAGIRLSSR